MMSLLTRKRKPAWLRTMAGFKVNSDDVSQDSRDWPHAAQSPIEHGGRA